MREDQGQKGTQLDKPVRCECPEQNSKIPGAGRPGESFLLWVSPPVKRECFHCLQAVTSGVVHLPEKARWCQASGTLGLGL